MVLFATLKRWVNSNVLSILQTIFFVIRILWSALLVIQT